MRFVLILLLASAVLAQYRGDDRVFSEQRRRFLAGTSGNVVASTFNLKNNDTIAQIGATGKILKKNTSLGTTVEAYASTAFDPVKRKIHFVGFGGGEGFIHTYNADTLEFEKEVYIVDVYAAIEVQFDAKIGKLIAVTGAETGFAIAAYDVDTGVRTDLISDFPDSEAIDETCCVYDHSTHRFYVAVITSNLTSITKYYQYNVMTRKLERIIAVDDFPQNAEFMGSKNRLVGLINETVVEVDLTTGKSVVYDKLDLNKIGFRELGASAIDVANQAYYVLYENHEAKTTWIRVDLNHYTYTANPFYDHIGTMIFVPSAQ